MTHSTHTEGQDTELARAWQAQPRVWQNRARTAQAGAEVWAAPRSPAGAVQAVTRAAAEGLKVRPVGAGTALSPLAAGQDVMLSSEGLRGLLKLDREAGTATVGAGTPLGELAAALETRGLTLSGLGGHAGQTVGGAIATGAHSSGQRQGRLSAQVLGLRLVDGLGRLHMLTPNDPHFGSAALSLGALGMVTAVTLRTEPLRPLSVTRRPLAWGEFMALGPEYAAAAPYAALTWVPGRDDAEAFTLRQAHPTDGPVPPGVPQPDGSLLDGAAAALKDAGTLSPLPAPVRRVLAARAGTAQTTTPAAALLAHGGPLRELEYAVPVSALTGTLRDLRAALARASASGTPLELPLHISFVAGDDLPLGSGREQGAWAVMTLAAPLGLPPEITAPSFREAETVLRAHAGRPAWGKLHALGEAELSGLYPGWAEFRAARDFFDPERRFASPYLRRVLGE